MNHLCPRTLTSVAGGVSGQFFDDRRPAGFGWDQASVPAGFAGYGLGRSCVNDLLDDGVDTNHHTERESDHTGRPLRSAVASDSDRTLYTFLGINSEPPAKELTKTPCAFGHASIWKAIWLPQDTARQVCIAAKRLAGASGIKIATAIFGSNMVWFFRVGLLEMIGSGVEPLLTNEDKAKGVVGATDLDIAVFLPENP